MYWFFWCARAVANEANIKSGMKLGTPAVATPRAVRHPPIRRPPLAVPACGLRRRRVPPPRATEPQQDTTVTTEQEGSSLEALYDASHKLDKREGPSTDLGVVIDRFWKVCRG